MEELPSNEIVRRVAVGLTDAGIVADSFNLGELQVYPFATGKLVLVAPADHEFAARKSLRFQDVVGQEFVGLPGGSALQEHIERHAARIGHTLKTRIRLATFESICRVVESGVGVAIVPEAAVRRFRHNLAMAVIGITDHWAPRELKICVRDFERLSPQAKQVVFS
jgi:DNA-binding transcriptional LysR family regulator